MAVKISWKRLTKRTPIPIIQLILVAFITYMILYPLIWMFAYSIRSNTAIYEIPPKLIPNKVVFENYATLFIKAPYGLYFRNSIFVAIGATFFSVIFASLGGYGLSRYHFLGKKGFTTFLIFSQMMPASVILIPLFLLWYQLGIFDTLFGLIIIYTVITLAFSTLLFRSFFNQIPRELDEAALIDGASKLQTFFKVILPLAGSAIVAVAIYTFTVVWEEFLLSITLTLSAETHTLPYGLMVYQGIYQTDWTGLMAASFTISSPAIIVFLILNRFFVKGMTAGAVKG